MFECSCPKATALTEVPTQDCPIDFSQIQRYGFQRGGNKFDTAGTPTSDITLLADWQVVRTATDDSKIVISPLLVRTQSSQLVTQSQLVVVTTRH